MYTFRQRQNMFCEFPLRNSAVSCSIYSPRMEQNFLESFKATFTCTYASGCVCVTDVWRCENPSRVSLSVPAGEICPLCGLLLFTQAEEDAG